MKTRNFNNSNADDLFSNHRWNGYVYLSPKGVKPPEPEPQRPAPSEEDEL